MLQSDDYNRFYITMVASATSAYRPPSPYIHIHTYIQWKRWEWVKEEVKQYRNKISFKISPCFAFYFFFNHSLFLSLLILSHHFFPSYPKFLWCSMYVVCELSIQQLLFVIPIPYSQSVLFGKKKEINKTNILVHTIYANLSISQYQIQSSIIILALISLFQDSILITNEE